MTLRVEAYLDYQQCVAEIAQTGTDRAQLFTRAADDKTSISIHGSASVLNALATFGKGDPVINSTETASRFLELAKRMRQEGAGKDGMVDLDDLRIVMFGNREWKT